MLHHLSPAEVARREISRQPSQRGFVPLRTDLEVQPTGYLCSQRVDGRWSHGFVAAIPAAWWGKTRKAVFDIQWAKRISQSIDRTCNIVARVEESRALTPPRPVFCAESYYDVADDPDQAYHARWQVWVAMLSGAAGYGYGAQGIWQFYDPADRKGETGKKESYRGQWYNSRTAETTPLRDAPVSQNVRLTRTAARWRNVVALPWASAGQMVKRVALETRGDVTTVRTGDRVISLDWSRSGEALKE